MSEQLLPIKGDFLTVSLKVGIDEKGKIKVSKTKPARRSIAAVYDHGGVLDSSGDVWNVEFVGQRGAKNLWQATL